MSNVTYQVERIEGDLVHLRETFDLTVPGPGILVRGGQVVDCKAKHISSAWRFITMTREQADARGLTSSSHTPQ